MKTKEFSEKVETLGLRVDACKFRVFVSSDKGDIIGIIGTENTGVMSTDYSHFETLEDNTKASLLGLMATYAITPIEERKEQEYYFIKHKYLEPQYNYLNHNTLLHSWFFHGQQRDSNYETQFKLKELPNWVHTMIEQGHLVKEEV